MISVLNKSRADRKVALLGEFDEKFANFGSQYDVCYECASDAVRLYSEATADGQDITSLNISSLKDLVNAISDFNFIYDELVKDKKNLESIFNTISLIGLTAEEKVDLEYKMGLLNSRMQDLKAHDELFDSYMEEIAPTDSK